MQPKSASPAGAPATSWAAAHYRAAAALIESGGLAKGFCRDGSGRSVPWSSPRAVRFSTRGALNRAAWDEGTLQGEIDKLKAAGCTTREAAVEIACDMSEIDHLETVGNMIGLSYGGLDELEQGVSRWNDSPRRTASEVADMLRQCARLHETGPTHAQQRGECGHSR